MYFELLFMVVFFQVGIFTRCQGNRGRGEISFKKYLNDIRNTDFKKSETVNRVSMDRAIYSLSNSVRNLQSLITSKQVLPRFCNGQWCDPNYEPYPNIVSTMTGYNVLKGNPFPTSNSVDPGFSTGYIFVPTVRTDDGTYALHSGITVRQSLQCDLGSNTETITSASQYIHKVLSKSSDGAELGATGYVKTVKVSFDAAFTASDEYKRIKQFFTEKHGVLTLQEATCTTYSVRISSFDPPSFSEAFIKSLRKLNDVVNKPVTDKDRIKKLEEFVEEFGTHYLQHTTMGARTAVTRKYYNLEFRDSTDEQLQKCSEDRLKLAIAGFGFGTNSDSCAAIEIDAVKNIKIGFNRESLVSYGSKPENNLSEWSRQGFESPLPIKMGLRPITDLLTENYLKKYSSINYESIVKMLIEFYSSYCSSYKLKLGIEDCAPSAKNICGLNDICNPRTEICIQENNNFTCAQRVCIFNNPCQNGASCEDISDQKPDQKPYKCYCKFGWEGENCDDQTDLLNIVNIIFKILKDSKYESINNLLFAVRLAADLNILKEFKEYSFVVTSMDPRKEAAIGTYFPIHDNYNHTILIGMAKVDLQSPKFAEAPEITKDITKSILYSGATNAQEVVDAVYKMYNKKLKKYPLVFIQAAEKGSNLNSNCNSASVYNNNYDIDNTYRPCIMVSSYVMDPVKEYDVIVFFGSLPKSKIKKIKKESK